MDNRIESSLNGHRIKINWRTPKTVNALIERSDKLQEEVFSEDIDVKEKEDKLEQYYKDASEIMFEFIGKDKPDDSFWEYESFPQGEFEYLQTLFMSPTKKM